MRPTRVHALLIDPGDFTGPVLLRHLHNLGYVLAQHVPAAGHWPDDSPLDLLLVSETGDRHADAATVASFRARYPELKVLYLPLDPEVTHLPGAHAVCPQDEEALDRLGIALHHLLKPAQGASALRFSPVFALLLLLCGLGATGCSTQSLFQSPRRSHKVLDSLAADFPFAPDDYTYTLRQDDKVSVSVWGNDDLSIGSLYGIYNSNEVYGKWVMVDPNGEIALPQIGNLFVRGKTILEVEALLRNKYSTLLLNPIIKVKVLNREVTILGEVRTPGNFLLEKERNTLLEVMGKSGAFEYYADMHHVQILRKGPDGQLHELVVDLTDMEQVRTHNMLILPGDVINVPALRGKITDRKLTNIIPLATAMTSLAILLQLIF